MRIVSKKTINQYVANNPQAMRPLDEWYKKTKGADWHNFADIRRTFATVSQVGNDRYVFNIKDNDYRLVVIILFTPHTVYIRFIGTHAEYDKIKDIQNI